MDKVFSNVREVEIALNILNYLIGKADFDLKTVLPKNTDLVKNYDSYESFTKTFATVGAGVLSSNIITPIVRNTTAADMQKNYINNIQFIWRLGGQTC